MNDDVPMWGITVFIPNSSTIIDGSGNRYRVSRGRAVPDRDSQNWERFQESWFDRLFRWLFG